MSELPVVVVGYVRSPEGEAALKHAIEEARRHGANMIVVHSARGGSHERGEEIVQDHDRLEEIDADLGGLGIEHEIAFLVQGHAPEDDIVAVAKERKAHLVVVGLRRRGPVGKAIFGSTAQQVLLHSPCPVLAVPSDQDTLMGGWI